jgi:hypothetical protein
VGRAHHEGVVAAPSVLNSGEGRRFGDQQWTRGKYTQWGASWGAFGRPTSYEKVEAEGGSHSMDPCQSKEEMERGGWLEVTTRQEEERGW